MYLTDEDIKELEEKIGSKVTNYIERLGAYMGSTGKTYKNGSIGGVQTLITPKGRKYLLC